jgi:hypothetical protein
MKHSWKTQKAKKKLKKVI